MNDIIWITFRGRHIPIKLGMKGKFDKKKLDDIKEKDNKTLSEKVKRGIAGNQSDLVGKDREEQKAINKEYLKQSSIANEKTEAMNYMQDQFKAFDKGDISSKELEQAKIDSGLSKEEIKEARDYTNARAKEDNTRISENKSGRTTFEPVPSKEKDWNNRNNYKQGDTIEYDTKYPLGLSEKWKKGEIVEVKNDWASRGDTKPDKVYKVKDLENGNIYEVSAGAVSKKINTKQQEERDTFNKISKFYGYDKLSNDQIKNALDFAEKRGLYHSKEDIQAMRNYLDRTVIEKDTGSAYSNPGKRWEVLEKSTSAYGKPILKVMDKDGNVQWKDATSFHMKNLKSVSDYEQYFLELGYSKANALKKAKEIIAERKRK